MMLLFSPSDFQRFKRNLRLRVALVGLLLMATIATSLFPGDLPALFPILAGASLISLTETLGYMRLLNLADGRARERLAEHEHVQWAAWTRHFLDNQTPENIARWRRQADTDYADLSEAEKDKDRVWADRAIATLLDRS